jgi:flagellar motor switch protein FliG
MKLNKRFSKLTGVEKSAILLLCLGEKASANVFEELNDTEIQQINRCMMNISHVPASLAQQVIEAFRKEARESHGLFVQGRDFVKKALSASPRKNRDIALLNRLETDLERPLATLSFMEPRQLAALLRNEHPQTIVLILATQSTELASQVLGFFPEELRADTILRIARTEKVSQDVIRQVEEALQREIGTVRPDQQHVGGIDKVVEILGLMERGLDQNILESINISDPDLAERIRRKMFTFEDLADLDGRALQAILREISNEQLILALKSCPETVKDKLLDNVSSRAAAMINEDLEALGPVRLSEVECMQKIIVDIALKLEEDGQIVIGQRGGNDVFV